MATIVTQPTPTYLQPADVRNRTQLADLKDMGIDDLTSLLTTAEDMIDAYVGRQRHHPTDLNVYRIFPRVQDVDRQGAVIIPYQVSQATLRQVEWLFTNWWSTSDTDELPLQMDVSDESIGGDGSIDQKYVRDGLDTSRATLSPNARAILEGFKSRTAGIDTANPRFVPDILYPSSRELEVGLGYLDPSGAAGIDYIPS